jgi:hypothetical protein
MVGGQTYPAGEYAVKTLVSASNLTYLQNRNEAESAMTVTHTIASGAPAKSTVLVFHRIGNRYFLHRVWSAGSHVGLEFRQSPAEKELAMNQTKAETVSVAAKIGR